MFKRLCSIALVLLAAASGAHAQQDPIHSAACRDAMARLQAQEAAAASSPQASSPRVQIDALRRAAVRACLGGTGDATPPPRAAQPPISVPPVVTRIPALPRPAAPGAPAPRAEPLRSITSCDANGCWTSDGARLQRAGPGLLGPRGFCSVQGSVLHCP